MDKMEMVTIDNNVIPTEEAPKVKKPKYKKMEKILNFLMKTGWKICPLITGNQGQGKTERIRAWAKSINRDLVIIHLASHEPTDISGMITEAKLKDVYKTDSFFIRAEKYTPDSQKGELLVTTWSTPIWLAALRPGTVIFLDEINRAPQYTLQAMFPLLLERTIHGYKIPDDCMIIAAQNPDSKDFHVSKFNDAAFTSRFLHLPYAVEAVDWFEYVKNKDCHEAIIKAVEAKPKEFLNNIRPSEVYENLRPDPRNLDILGCSLLPNITQEEFDEFGEELIFGIVGMEMGTMIIEAYNKKLKFIDPIVLVTKYETVRKQIQEMTKEHRNDQIDAVTGGVLNALKAIAALEKKKEEWADVITNLAQFIIDIPSDSSFAFISKIKEMSGDNTDAMKIFLSLSSSKYKQQIAAIFQHKLVKN